jgi:hypothetical protein
MPPDHSMMPGLCFQEVDELRATNKALRAEVAALSADKGHLQQACDSRSSHAMTLIAENKRLIEQVRVGQELCCLITAAPWADAEWRSVPSMQAGHPHLLLPAAPACDICHLVLRQDLLPVGVLWPLALHLSILQVADLRRQVVQQDQDLWRIKQVGGWRHTETRW